MNRFIIVKGLPYLYANGKAYKVRWDEKGFTVGSEARLKLEKNPHTYCDLSIKAKCACLDSIKEKKVENKEAEAPVEEAVAEVVENKEVEPEQVDA